MKNSRKQRIRGLYHFWAKYYDFFMKYWNKYLAKGAEKDLNNFLKKNIKKEIEVLDLACGTGVNIERLKKNKAKIKKYVGVDLSTDMQAKAKKKAKDIKNKTFLIKDITEYKPGKKFDLIICTWALSHMKKPAEVVNKYYKYLKKGGYLILIFQSEFEKHRILQKILKKFEKIFQARLVPETEIKKFPKSLTLRKSYLKGYIRLSVIIKK